MRKLIGTSLALAALAICSIPGVAIAHPAHAGPAFYVHSKLYPTNMPNLDKGAAIIAFEKGFSVAISNLNQGPIHVLIADLSGVIALRDFDSQRGSGSFVTIRLVNLDHSTVYLGNGGSNDTATMVSSIC